MVSDAGVDVALAHSLLVTAYHVLARQTTYQEFGADHYDSRHTERAKHRAIQAREAKDYRHHRKGRPRRSFSEEV